jgi:hypothetical protein
MSREGGRSGKVQSGRRFVFADTLQRISRGNPQRMAAKSDNFIPRHQGYRTLIPTGYRTRHAPQVIGHGGMTGGCAGGFRGDTPSLIFDPSSRFLD